MLPLSALRLLKVEIVDGEPKLSSVNKQLTRPLTGRLSATEHQTIFSLLTGSSAIGSVWGSVRTLLSKPDYTLKVLHMYQLLNHAEVNLLQQSTLAPT